MNLLRFVQRPRPAASQREVIGRIDEALTTMITRGRFLGDRLEFGPNFVHAYVMRGPSGEHGAPGSVIDLGWSHNLKTTVGMDWLHNTMGGNLGSITGSPATATSATSLSGTSPGWTTDAWKGMRVVADNGTGTPTIGNIGSNTAAVLTIDSWINAADGTAATPSATAAFGIIPAQGPARYIGISANTVAPAVGDTTLAGEETTNGLQRALATFAHTGGATTFTQSKTFTASGAFTAEHKCGLFTAGTSAAAGVLVAATVLNADATLASGDSIAVTWTWTLPAAG